MIKCETYNESFIIKQVLRIKPCSQNIFYKKSPNIYLWHIYKRTAFKMISASVITEIWANVIAVKILHSKVSSSYFLFNTEVKQHKFYLYGEWIIKNSILVLSYLFQNSVVHFFHCNIIPKWSDVDNQIINISG